MRSIDLFDASGLGQLVRDDIRVARALVATGAQDVIDLFARRGPARNRAAATELRVVGASHDDEHAVPLRYRREGTIKHHASESTGLKRVRTTCTGRPSPR